MNLFRIVVFATVSAVSSSFSIWAGAPTPSADTLFLANFDGPNAAGTLALHGAAYAVGKWGRGLRIGRGQYATVSLDKKSFPDHGTILFWFKPEWREADARTRSHTFLSWSWNDGKGGYCAWSDGWWEPAGAGRTYLVFENQLYCHVSDTVEYPANEWTHLAMTWAFEKGSVSAAFYQDGRLVGVTPRRKCPKLPALKTPIVIGADKGTPIAKGRSAEGVYDGLQILKRALTPQEVRAVFRLQAPNWRRIERRRFAWLDSVLAQPYTPLRDKAGHILESRALLDESYGWITRKGAQSAVAKMKEAGFNVFIPCIWHGRGARWPSRRTPMETGAAKAMLAEGKDFDGLANLITVCHANGIEVHPWFCVCYGDRRWKPLAPFMEPGTPKGACEAHNPAFRRFIVDLMLEAVQRYDIDGVNLDYIRTMGLSTSKTARDAFRKQFGGDLLEAMKKPGPNHGPNPEIVRFQNDAIAAIVRTFAVRARALRPRLVISVDGHPRLPDEPPGIQGRDGIAWVRNGWIDVLYSMDYGQRIGWQRYDRLRALLERPEALVVLCGNYERLPNGQVGSRAGWLVAGLIGFCQRKYPGNGVALYWLGSLDEDQARALRSGPFKNPARPYWRRAHPRAKGVNAKFR